MEKDESQTKKRREIRSPKEAIARIKAKDEAKKKSEAERLFYFFFPEALHWKADYSQPLAAFDPITYVPYLKEAALAILGTGIIGENGLMDYEGHKEIFHFDRRDLKDLISALVDVHFKYQEIIFSPGDILKHFDNLFKSVAAFVRLVGVKDSGGRGLKRFGKSGEERCLSQSLKAHSPLIGASSLRLP